MDESGQPVDWFAVFKFHGGLDYAYIDVNTASSDGALKLTGRNLSSTDTAVGATFAQLYGSDAKSSVAMLAYNDEPPGSGAGEEEEDEMLLSSALKSLRGKLGAGAAAALRSGLSTSTSGHTKGVLAADKNGGFWMVHSVPKYPDLTLDRYDWTASTTYGQSFLCMSFDPSTVEDAATQVSYNDPDIYHSNMPSSLAAQYSTMEDVIKGTRGTGTKVSELYSLAGHSFTSYAKSGSWGKDLYEDLVQPALKLNFMWETWRRSPQMATYCKPTYDYDSINVQTLRFIDSDGKDAEFKYTQDHSKYGLAVNATSSNHWVCIGDINRMTSQWARGGGTVCLRASQLYYPLQASIVTADHCSE
jgi:deoxyribonuclease-2